MNHDAPEVGNPVPEQPRISISRSTAANDRIRQAIEANPWLAPHYMGLITDNICRGNSGFRSKRSTLFKVADSMHHALQPYTTCHKGCSYCCSSRTLIYRFEALTLAKVTGRKMVEIPYRSQAEVIETGCASQPQICPFVVDDCCSVYEHRPMICRLHHSFNDDPRDCEVTLSGSSRSAVVMYDPDIVETPYHQLVRSHNAKEPWGTITEFFPVLSVGVAPTEA